jgi:hypothetical protein
MSPEESARLAHWQSEASERVARVPVPSPQDRPETHSEAMAASHEGQPTVADQQKRQDYP